MLKIKFEGRHFSGELNFSGPIEKFLEEIPTETKEILVSNTEELLRAYCSAISGSILVPSVFPCFCNAVSQALQNVAKTTIREMKKLEVQSNGPQDMGSLIEN